MAGKNGTVSNGTAGHPARRGGKPPAAARKRAARSGADAVRAAGVSPARAARTARASGDAGLEAPSNGTVAAGARPATATATATPPPTPAFVQGSGKGGAEARVYVGDCREVVPRIPECARREVDLVFADPPFNWNRAYDEWDDAMPRDAYVEEFTYPWLDACVDALSPRGSMWVNIPDDTAAEIVVHLKRRGLEMVNWCVWHYRFGQNCTERFISSKVHALYFARDRRERTWNPMEILEPSDRATTYFDPRTHEVDPRTSRKRDGMPPGKRVPMDVWYGKYWGRIQGNNKERRARHDNQLPEVYLERVVRACSDAGMLVLDPFLGSGTTGVVAHALGRRFIGVEYSAENAASAFERIGAGPLRLGEGLGQSTAIFKPRRRGGEAGADGAGARRAGKNGTL